MQVWNYHRKNVVMFNSAKLRSQWVSGVAEGSRDFTGASITPWDAHDDCAFASHWHWDSGTYYVICVPELIFAPVP